MTDLNTISFWKSRLKEEFEDPNSISKKLERENGSLLFSIHQAVERINENNELITKTRWHWWWQIKIAERIIKKFKIKTDIYRNKKAKEVWRHCYQDKKYKMKHPQCIKVGKDEIIGYLERMANDDMENIGAYIHIINKIQNK
jgi:hypothetical protein